MKKKILLGLGLGFLAVIVVVVIVVGFFLGNVVKAGMNTVGPTVTQTAFSVDAVHIMPLLGSVSLENFVIGNPAGYSATNLISVGKTAVSVQPLSVLSGKIVVKNVEVHDAVINFEGNPLTKNNNLQKLLDNVNAFTGGSAKPVGTNAPAPAGAAKPAKKLEVDHFQITGAKVRFNGLTLPLPGIELTNLGTGPDGITPVELFKDVLGEVTSSTLKAVAASAVEAGKAVVNEGAKAVKSVGNSIGNLFK